MGGKFYKLTMNDVPLRGKTILLRTDYNVPLTKDGKVADDYRIRMSLPTIEKLLDANCRIVIISHLGRPEGKKNPEFSLQPAVKRLAELLKRDVRFVDDCVGHKVFMAVKRAPLGSVTVLENLRFYPGEEANDADFAHQIAKQSHAQYFVQDGFGVVHRAHASTSAITQYLPSMAGLLLEREYMTITEAMKNPQRPFVAVMGGAKVSDKIGVIEKMVDIADHVVIGGAMANTFLDHNGNKMGRSKLESDQDAIIEKIYSKASRKTDSYQPDELILLPTDLGVAASLEADAVRRDVSIADVGPEDYALDIGPQSVDMMLKLIDNAATVVWNGTLGMCELPAFSAGSEALASNLANSNKVSIIGGGDTADFVLHWDKKHGESFTHVSTGGGASLELMSGLRLPGIECLLPAKK